MRSRTNWINGCKKLWLKVRLNWKVNVHSTKPKKTRTCAQKHEKYTKYKNFVQSIPGKPKLKDMSNHEKGNTITYFGANVTSFFYKF